MKSRKKVYLSGKLGTSEQVKFAKLTQDIHDKIEVMGDQIAISSKQHLTTVEASKYLGISKHTLDSYASKNIIPYYKPQNRLRYYLKEDLDNFAVNNASRIKSREEIEAEASSWSLTNKR